MEKGSEEGKGGRRRGEGEGEEGEVVRWEEGVKRGERKREGNREGAAGGGTGVCWTFSAVSASFGPFQK